MAEFKKLKPDEYSEARKKAMLEIEQQKLNNLSRIIKKIIPDKKEGLMKYIGDKK